MVAATSLSIEQLPAEMVAAVVTDAARDADRVIQFLSHFRLGGTPKKPRPMPARFLLHLGAALRLLNWEEQNFFPHRAVGLPEAEQAIRDAFFTLTDRDADPVRFCVAVLRLSIERFAWTGPPDLGADVALDEVQEEALLEVLADYLWAQRPR